MKKYQLICMSFDGDFKRETPKFEYVDETWEYSNDLGSKWFFYPFHFVVSGNKIIQCGHPMLDFTEGKKLPTIARLFKEQSTKEFTQNMDAEEYAFSF